MTDDEIRQYYDILPEGHTSLPERYRDLERENARLLAENARLRDQLATYTGITETVEFPPKKDDAGNMLPTSNLGSYRAEIDLRRTR